MLDKTNYTPNCTPGTVAATTWRPTPADIGRHLTNLWAVANDRTRLIAALLARIEALESRFTAAGIHTVVESKWDEHGQMIITTSGGVVVNLGSLVVAEDAATKAIHFQRDPTTNQIIGAITTSILVEPPNDQGEIE
jgi:hypothetical protein